MKPSGVLLFNQSAIYAMLFIILTALFLILCLCFIIPKARNAYFDAVKDSFAELSSILKDCIIRPFGSSVGWKFILALPFSIVVYVLAVILFIALFVTVAPAATIIKSCLLKREDRKEGVNPVSEKEKDFVSFRSPIRYKVSIDDLTFDPSSHEVVFYNPTGNSLFDGIIGQNIEKIQQVFSSHGMRLVYLPKYNQTITPDQLQKQLEYASPAVDNNIQEYQALTYSDISEAYHIPESVSEPCLVRCMSADYDRGFRLWGGKTDLTGISFDESSLYFSIKYLESTDLDSFISEVKTYLKHCYTGPLYHINTEEETEAGLAGLSADERFDEDMYIIGREIRERIDRLRAKGLSSLAIRKLIGEDSDKPGKLLIDRHNRLFLTDFGNKEIKLSPIHKAVFFLFLRHPEGIYFKDLANYREELGRIYREITGRDDMAAVEDSINKLTDPYDNSINEKCARIKNAFVSEFREEVAQWYFINGSKGEKKTIKLPRELVTWEIKD